MVCKACAVSLQESFRAQRGAHIDLNGVGVLAQPRAPVGEPNPCSGGTAALPEMCPDLGNWPQNWCCEHADIALGERILKYIRPFLLHLLEQGLATKTLHRHRDYLWMLGGGIILRRHEDSNLRRIAIENILLHLVNDQGEPLIWPRLSQQQQEAFDATCRKLHRFVSTSPTKKRKPTHRFR